MSKVRPKPQYIPLAQTLRDLREQNNLTVTLAAAMARIDIAILSKIERDERKPTKDQLLKLAHIYNANPKILLLKYMSEKIMELIALEEDKQDILKSVSKLLDGQPAKKTKRK